MRTSIMFVSNAFLELYPHIYYDYMYEQLIVPVSKKDTKIWLHVPLD